MRPTTLTAVSLIFALAAGSATAQTPNGAFRATDSYAYQGKLLDAGEPANGAYDLEFSLYDQPTGGRLLATETKMAVRVTGGTFSAPLDFGETAADGGWLEVRVWDTETSSYTALLPRQKVAKVIIQPPDLYCDVDSSVRVHGFGSTLDDVAPNGGGMLILGEHNGPNLGLDPNEIMARDGNGNNSPLYLNWAGLNSEPVHTGGKLAVGGDIEFQGRIDLGLEMRQQTIYDTYLGYVMCPPTKVAISGGCLTTNGWSVKYDRMRFDNTTGATGWECSAQHPDDPFFYVRVRVLCANAKAASVVSLPDVNPP